MTGLDNKDRNETGAEVRHCPICDKPADPAHRPFCSRRCADLDLHRWLSDRYVIPADDEDTIQIADSDPSRP